MFLVVLVLSGCATGFGSYTGGTISDCLIAPISESLVEIHFLVFVVCTLVKDLC